MIPIEEAVSLLRKVLRVDTVNPPGDELEVARILERFFRENGIEAKVDEFSPGRANLLARLHGEAGHAGSLVFCGHMDVVPAGGAAWEFDPFEAEERDGRIYGRGASDMKGGLVAMAVALANLKRGGSGTGEISFAATAGEEVDCCGMRRLVERGTFKDVSGVVIAEPTREDVVLAHKGALWIQITTRGKTAHGSMPEEGINAIEHMHRLLDVLLERFRFDGGPDPVLGSPTLSVNRIDGGVKVNVVPDECILQVDIRSTPRQEHDGILERLRQCLDDARNEVPNLDYDLLVLQERSPVSTPADAELARIAEDLRRERYGSPSSRLAVPYYTDASILAGSSPKLPVVVYGPGDDRLAHQPNEWVSVEAFQRSIGFFEELARRHSQADGRTQRW